MRFEPAGVRNFWDRTLPAVNIDAEDRFEVSGVDIKSCGIEPVGR